MKLNLKKPSPWLLFPLLMVVVDTVYVLIKGTALINSDSSSELILASILNAEGGILSRNWYYSSELRVLNTNLIYKIGLLFFPGDYHLARTLSVFLFMLILAGAVFFLMWAAGREKMGFVAAGVLIAPFGDFYAWNIIYNSYYVPHVVISLLSLGLLLLSLRLKGRRAFIPAGLLLLLAFGAGLGGVRQLLVCYVPLLAAQALLIIAGIWRESHRRLVISSGVLAAGCFVSCTLGYIVNKTYLADIYSFINYGDTAFSALDLRNCLYVLGELFSILGWKDDAGIMSLQGGVNLTALGVSAILFAVILIESVRVILSVYHNDYTKDNIQENTQAQSDTRDNTQDHTRDNTRDNTRDDTRDNTRDDTRDNTRDDTRDNTRDCHRDYSHALLVLFAAMGLLIQLIIYGNTVDYNRSYWIPLVPFIIIAGLSSAARIGRAFTGNVVIGLVIALTLAHSVATMQNPYVSIVPNSASITGAADWLIENGYTRGFGTFWNGNILTEISSGGIEMWVVDDYRNPIPKQWLQKTAHSTQAPVGRVFFIVHKFECENGTFPYEECRDRVVHETSQYYIFDFEDVGDYLKVL